MKKLIASGFETKNLSVVGKGYHTDEKVVGFYTTGDRVKFWGSRGAFLGGFWGLLFGGLSALGAALYSLGIPKDSLACSLTRPTLRPMTFW